MNKGQDRAESTNKDVHVAETTSNDVAQQLDESQDNAESTNNVGHDDNGKSKNNGQNRAESTNKDVHVAETTNNVGQEDNTEPASKGPDNSESTNNVGHGDNGKSRTEEGQVNAESTNKKKKKRLIIHQICPKKNYPKLIEILFMMQRQKN